VAAALADALSAGGAGYVTPPGYVLRYLIAAPGEESGPSGANLTVHGEGERNGELPAALPAGGGPAPAGVAGRAAVGRAAVGAAVRAGPADAARPARRRAAGPGGVSGMSTLRPLHLPAKGGPWSVRRFADRRAADVFYWRLERLEAGHPPPVRLAEPLLAPDGSVLPAGSWIVVYRPILGLHSGER